MKAAVVSVFAAILIFTGARTLVAQPADARVTNPGTLEFQMPAGVADTAGISTYRIELFLAGSDTSVAVPAKVVDVAAKPDESGQLLRVDFRGVLEGISNGDYVATIRTVRPDGTSPRSAPTPPFVVSGSGSFRPPEVASTTAAPAPPTVEERRRERFWTKIAIIIGAACLFVPLAVP